jgi:hypothetical protein
VAPTDWETCLHTISHQRTCVKQSFDHTCQSNSAMSTPNTSLYGHMALPRLTVRTVQSVIFFACLTYRIERDIFSIWSPFDKGMLQKKWHAKRSSKAPRNDPTTSPPQNLLCIKNGFGLVSLQYKSTLTAPMASEHPKTPIWALSAPQSIEKRRS